VGRTVQQTDALQNVTLAKYDHFNQVMQVIYPDNTAQVPRVATYIYDAYGKVLTQSGTGQYPISYTFDAAGNRTALTDGNNSKPQ
jgi:YD repeat-containing protein